MTNVIICFKPPENGGYIGGFTTLCNDYINNKDLFIENGVNIAPFYYRLSDNNFYYRCKSSVIKNIIYGMMQCRALRAFLRKNPDTTVHIHTSRRWLFAKDVWLAYMIRRLVSNKNKIILTIHVGDISTVFYNRVLMYICIKLMNCCVDKAIFLSAKMKQQFIDAGLDPHRSSVLYNFYNVNITKSPKNNDIPQIVYLGSINKEKGILELLESVSRINRMFVLHICGSIIEDSIRKPFNDWLVQLGDRVIFHGYVNKDEKNKILSKADILVLPSYREGLPISILEAMANSCAIVTTPVGAIPEILDNQHALYVTPANSQELSNAINKLLGNPNLMQEMQVVNYIESAKYQLKEHIRYLCMIYGE